MAGTAVACGLLMFAVIYVAVFALLRKKRATQLSGQENPFGEVLKNTNYDSNYVAVNAA
jgi:hypothetical protein